MGINQKEPVADPELYVGPMLLMMRRLERFELLIKQLHQRGLITDSDLEKADLQSTLAHAERIIKVRGRSGRQAADVKDAAQLVRVALKKIS